MGQEARTETEGDAVLNPRPPMTVRLWRQYALRPDTTIPQDVRDVVAVSSLVWLVLVNLWLLTR